MGGNRKAKPWGAKLTDEQMASFGLRFKERQPAEQIDFGHKRVHGSEIQVSSHAMQRMSERDTSLCDALRTQRAVVKDNTVVTVLPPAPAPQ